MEVLKIILAFALILMSQCFKLEGEHRLPKTSSSTITKIIEERKAALQSQPSTGQNLDTLEAELRSSLLPGSRGLLNRLLNWKGGRGKGNAKQSKLNNILKKHASRQSKWIAKGKLNQLVAKTDKKKKTIVDIPGQEICGSSFAKKSEYIIGGNTVSIERYPWMVQLIVPRYTNIKAFPSPPEFEAVGCAAAIISNQWLLTATHCIIDYMFLKEGLQLGVPIVNPEIERGLGAFIGETNFLNDSSKIIRFNPFEIVRHANYSETGLNDNDISLIHLDKPLDFSTKTVARPLCLPEEGELASMSEGHRCEIAGWGVESEIPETRYPVSLQAAEVFIKDTQTCNETYKNLPGFEQNGTMRKLSLPRTHLCAGGIGGVPDVCLADSGGPLMCTSPKTGKLLAAGIVSFGPGESQLPPGTGICGQVPSAYTDLRQYIPWLKQIILGDEVA